MSTSYQALAVYPPRDHAEKITAYSDLATIVSLRGDMDEAEQLTRQALALSRQTEVSGLLVANTLRDPAQQERLRRS